MSTRINRILGVGTRYSGVGCRVSVLNSKLDTRTHESPSTEYRISGVGSRYWELSHSINGLAEVTFIENFHVNLLRRLFNLHLNLNIHVIGGVIFWDKVAWITWVHNFAGRIWILWMSNLVVIKQEAINGRGIRDCCGCGCGSNAFHCEINERCCKGYQSYHPALPHDPPEERFKLCLDELQWPWNGDLSWACQVLQQGTAGPRAAAGLPNSRPEELECKPKVR
ncbi:uncharacterized protein EDB91DRAFT_1086946 [Suillus paluster]|uniref:uncharacterized protein n=1 Tax=Suillus paluster TaxID=48578 RepID=UPI001B85DEB7|nr:uncharacterized protein EDB91DRAFT_1086946 [Suillus paluster]KAG1725867.1 hypothetical protein EDB91DRAFT_1086946 [Suillus paluster]